MPEARHFLTEIVQADNAAAAWGLWSDDDARPKQGPDPVEPASDAVRQAARDRLGKPRVHTRFPPEPNGYLHIGHAKSICLNFGLARDFLGKFNLRFDDTNPAKEEQEYVDSIIRDVRWLGADFDPATGPFGGGLYFASNYFQLMYDLAEDLVRKGLAYVCDLSADQVAARRGTPQVPATSPFRDRPPDESLRLLREMREGRHPDGSRTLRARIDLASPNFNLRDPVLYRILHETHHNTGSDWCIYPMYDWAHGLEDSAERITHSICTLEFENHRPLYDWLINAVNQGRPPDQRIHHARQIEFARLNLTYTVLSKRRLVELVKGGHVRGWDDPRMPTIAAFRRRGFTAEAIRAFCDEIGVTRTESVIDLGRLENACREHLNRAAPRRMAVLRPLRVVVESWPEGEVDWLDAVNNPEDPAAGTRRVPFTRELFIEHDDFMENPPKGYFRLAPGAEVRLRYAYFIKAVGVEKDAAGNTTLVRAVHDPQTRGGDAPKGPDGKPLKKVKGTIHWVSAPHARAARVRLFDRLFADEHPGRRTGNYLDDLNPNSIEELADARVEPALIDELADGSAAAAWPDGIARFQFERLGYFCADTEPGAAGENPPVFNRTVTLKDSWAKEQRAG